MPINKYTKHIMTIMIAGYLFCGVLHFIDIHLAISPIRLSAFSYLGYTGLSIAMYFYVQKDLPNRYSRNHFLAAILLMIFWQLIDLLRLMVPFAGNAFQHFLWYAIYLPINFIPTCMLIILSTSDVTSRQRADRRWVIPHIISAVFLLITLTNDRHRLVFDFTDPKLAYDVHSYQPLYFVMMFWSLAQLIVAIFILQDRARQDKIGGSGIYVFITMICTLVYFSWYVAGRPVAPWFDEFFPLSAFWLAIFFLPFEIAVRRGHIRSNFNFMETLEGSSLAMTIEDKEGKVFLQTMSASHILETDRVKARSGSVYLDDTHVMHSREITGGRVFWVEDMSEVHKITKNLQLSKDALAKEAIAHTSATEDGNHIYDLLLEEAAPQFERLGAIIDEMDPMDDGFDSQLKEACFYKTYIKHLYLMRLLAENKQQLELDELEKALKDSVSYLPLQKAQTNVQVHGSGLYSAEYLIFLYALFQMCVETLGVALNDIHLHISTGEGIPDADYTFGVDEDYGREELNEFVTMTSWFKDDLAVFDATLDAERTNNGVSLRIRRKEAVA